MDQQTILSQGKNLLLATLATMTLGTTALAQSKKSNTKRMNLTEAQEVRLKRYMDNCVLENCITGLEQAGYSDEYIAYAVEKYGQTDKNNTPRKPDTHAPGAWGTRSVKIGSGAQKRAQAQESYQTDVQWRLLNDQKQDLLDELALAEQDLALLEEELGPEYDLYQEIEHLSRWIVFRDHVQGGTLRIPRDFKFGWKEITDFTKTTRIYRPLDADRALTALALASELPGKDKKTQKIKKKSAKKFKQMANFVDKNRERNEVFWDKLDAERDEIMEDRRIRWRKGQYFTRQDFNNQSYNFNRGWNQFQREWRDANIAVNISTGTLRKLLNHVVEVQVKQIEPRFKEREQRIDHIKQQIDIIDERLDIREAELNSRPIRGHGALIDDQKIEEKALHNKGDLVDADIDKIVDETIDIFREVFAEESSEILASIIPEAFENNLQDMLSKEEIAMSDRNVEIHYAARNIDKTLYIKNIDVVKPV